MTDDANEGLEGTQEGEGSEGTPDPKASDPAAEIASYRKRQAGAEAARQAAEARAKDLEKKLAEYEQKNQTEAEKELSELARQTARAEAAEQRAAEAEAKAEARILDAKYPNARKDLPEVTDEVRLAKFEAMLAEGDYEPPTPESHNESKTGAQAGDKARKPKSAADLRAELEATPLPEGW